MAIHFRVQKTIPSIITAILLAVLTHVGVTAGNTTTKSADNLPPYLRDRGIGTPMSIFATYAAKGELLVYPFWEHYLDNNAEYAPNEFGFNSDQDYRGKYTASEGLLFLGYGLTDNISLELEGAIIGAELNTSPQDKSGVPEEIEEWGLGDVQTQINWLWSQESQRRPAFFSYFEIVYPFNKNKDLIGTADWEFKLGTGLIRGFRWGTVTVRAGTEYIAAENRFDLGGMAIEYLKRLSPKWRLYAGLEGTQDELEFITEAQWQVSRGVTFKINNAFGVTSKATDWAPELGVMFSIPVR